MQSGALSQEATRKRYTLKKPPGQSRYEIAEGEQINVRLCKPLPMSSELHINHCLQMADLFSTTSSRSDLHDGDKVYMHTMS